MTIVTRKQFEQMDEVLGGDFWNQYKLCKYAFSKYPSAESISYSISTGLWVRLTYLDKDGVKHEGAVYGSDHTYL